MSLFNSKEPEKAIKTQPGSSPQAQPTPSTPITLPAEKVVEVKAIRPNNNDVAPAPRPVAPISSDARAYLDAGSKISGKLYFETAARIDGQVEGEILAKDSLTIGESAVVAAQIKAASVIVAGKVSGDIIALQRIEIRPSAKVLGNITAPTLAIQEGALFEGHCAMQAEAHDERKVTVFPKEERIAQAVGQKPA
ncbi:MAG TPA: polymer-forming cytoskeletal protein [Candidatus Binataceae bacterium]|nr:polymer-forming cytoskeletal protein [Candidatus Binataceae bacterium]